MGFQHLWRIKPDPDFNVLYFCLLGEFVIATLIVAICWLRMRARSAYNRIRCSQWLFCLLALSLLMRASLYLEPFVEVPLEVVALSIFLPELMKMLAGLLLVYYR